MSRVWTERNIGLSFDPQFPDAIAVTCCVQGITSDRHRQSYIFFLSFENNNDVTSVRSGADKLLISMSHRHKYAARQPVGSHQSIRDNVSNHPNFLCHCLCFRSHNSFTRSQASHSTVSRCIQFTGRCQTGQTRGCTLVLLQKVRLVQHLAESYSVSARNRGLFHRQLPIGLQWDNRQITEPAWSRDSCPRIWTNRYDWVLGTFQSGFW